MSALIFVNIGQSLFYLNMLLYVTARIYVYDHHILNNIVTDICLKIYYIPSTVRQKEQYKPQHG